MRRPLLRLTFCSLLLSLMSANPGASAAEPAHSADQFVNSIGVNVHMSYGDTAYGERERLVDKLSQAGIRHVRDGLGHNMGYLYPTYTGMAARGIKTTFIMGDPSERRDTLEQLLAELRTSVRGAAEAVEGPNEYSYSGDPEWVSRLRAYQSRLYDGVKQDPRLSSLPVLAPSLISQRDHEMLGNLTPALDFGNKHSYPGGDIPEANITSELTQAARVSGDRGTYVTESGYHNALNTDSGHRPTSEQATATYLPRMYLEYFRRGIPRTFAYELIDEWADPAKTNLESNFGLLRNDYSEKPSFQALSNLIAVLEDSGPAFSTSPLDYSIAGAPPDLRQLVLEKRDGSHYLVLWRATRVWDPVARRAVMPDTRNVSVTLPGASNATDVIAPVTSRHATTSVPTGQTVPLALKADPIILRVPASRSASPGPVSPSTSPAASPPAAQPAANGPLPVPSIPAGGTRPQSAAPAPLVPIQTVWMPSRQRAHTVRSKGVEIRCRSTVSASCRASILGQHSRVIASRSSLLGAGRKLTMRLRLSATGRSFVRRSLRHHRRVMLTVRARVGRGQLVTRNVSVVR